MRTRTSPFGRDFSLSFKEGLDEFRGFVRNSERYFGLNWEQLADAANLHYETVCRLGNGATLNPRLETKEKLEKVFLDREHIYRRAVGIQTVAPVTVRAAPAALTMDGRKRREKRVPRYVAMQEPRHLRRRIKG